MEHWPGGRRPGMPIACTENNEQIPNLSQAASNLPFCPPHLYSSSCFPALLKNRLSSHSGKTAGWPPASSSWNSVLEGDPWLLTSLLGAGFSIYHHPLKDKKDVLTGRERHASGTDLGPHYPAGAAVTPEAIWNLSSPPASLVSQRRPV
ncbi:hypothetical protein CapIbe_006731 [Capra ibex]